jgi:hypothetical protein
MTAMLTAVAVEQLKNATQKYLNNPAFDMFEVAGLMAKIFGNNPDSTDALAWSAYRMQLNIYEEGMRDGKTTFEAPEVCLILCQLVEQLKADVCSIVIFM